MHPDPTLIVPAAYTQAQLPLILLHAGAGGLALIASAIAIATRKGGPAHRRAGRVFTGAMVCVGLTAFAAAVVRPNPFLFGIGVFSLYLSLSGWLAARGRIGRPLRQAGVLLARLMLGAGAAMAASGLAGLAGEPHARGLLAGGAPMFVVFGAIGAFRARADLRAAGARTEARHARLARHAGLMVAASIAAWTAFAVVNDAGRLPVYLVWFGPTALGVPLIVWWQKRLSSARAAAPVASRPCAPSSS